LPTSQVLTTACSVVTPDFFRAAGMSVLRGRSLSELDNISAPHVVLVNQKFVDRYVQREQAIGKQIRLEVSGEPAEWSEIVGVVNNVKTYPETATEDPTVYESFLQRPVASFVVMVRTMTDPNHLISAVRNTVAQVDPDLPLARLTSMSAIIDRQTQSDSFFSRALAGFAFLALMLAAIGIYGLIAYSVGQRTHEIGIRMALGAKSQDVLRMVIREGMKIAVIGGCIGLALSLPLPKLFESIFFDLHVREMRLYFFVPLAVLIVAVVATYIPAHRAAGVEPMTALRQE
jgi:predicted permease